MREKETKGGGTEADWTEREDWKNEREDKRERERERERWDESVHTVKRRVEPPSGAAGKIASESLYGLPAALLRNPLACPFF